MAFDITRIEKQPFTLIMEAATKLVVQGATVSYAVKTAVHLYDEVGKQLTAYQTKD